MSTITSANNTFTLAISGAFPVPQTLRGWAADDSFAVQAVQKVEVLMGIDGKMSYGYVFSPYEMDITFQADSASIDIFYTWQLFQDAQREAANASGSIVLPGQGTKYTLVNGVMTRFKPLPDSKRVLQPQAFQITWENIIAEPFA